MVAGRLTRDPEQKVLPSGMAVCNFSLATNHTYKDQEETEFHNVVAFGKTAESIGRYKKKGDLIFVTGRLKTRSWESDGTKQYRTEIMVDRAQFIGKGSNEASPATAEPTSAPEYPDEEIRPEDIPF